jgi:8-oxo-dGTP diphosphatase
LEYDHWVIPGSQNWIDSEVIMFFNCRAIIERGGPDGKEVLIQERNKPHEGQTCLELPGGRVEEFESLIDTLKREVREETGLELSFIQGQETRVETSGMDARVECLQPFAAYQTIHGLVDSFGLYFICQADGQLLAAGDETRGMGWMPISDIARLLNDASERISFVDRAGLAFYLKKQVNA